MSSSRTEVLSSGGLCNLPQEVLGIIVSHLSQNDKISFAVTHSTFHATVAREIYRSFHIVFHDEDRNYTRPSLNKLSGCLDTLVRTERNYPDYVRDFRLDTHHSCRTEPCYKDYHYKNSTGQMLNTLICLALAKTHGLKAFRWNVRIELVPRIFELLAQRKCLEVFSMRMHAGPSLANRNADSLPILSTHSNENLELKNPLGPELEFIAPPPPTHLTIGRLSNLKELSVLDISNFNILPEIRSCIRSSVQTLRTLRISMASELAWEAVPLTPPETMSDDSDFDNEYVPQGPAGTSGIPPDVRFTRAKHIRKALESVLGRVLDIEAPHIEEELQKHRDEKNKKLERWATSVVADLKTCENSLLDKIALSNQRGVRDYNQKITRKLRQLSQLARDIEDECKLENQEFISGTPGSYRSRRRSGRKYHDNSDKIVTSSRQRKEQTSTDMIKNVEDQGDDDDTEPDQESDGTEGEKPVAPSEKLLGKRPVGKSTVELYMADNMAENMADKPTYPVSLSINQPDLKAHKKEAADRRKKAETRRVNLAKVEQDLVEAEGLELDNESMMHLQGALTMAKLLLAVAEEQALHAESMVSQHEAGHDGQNMTGLQSEETARYIKKTRGLQLQVLEVSKLFVKTSIVLQAIDLSTLRELTLMMTGDQIPLWNMIAEENQKSPLPLRKIYTDDATQPFLKCAVNLEQLDSLLLTNPRVKARIETPRPCIPISEIRRIVLNKKIKQLKVLMLDNQRGRDWDLDETTVWLIATRGKKLEQLASSMCISSFHMFLQHFRAMKALEALHIIDLRSDDTCVWVLRESRRFVVDCIAQNPTSRLKWLCVNDSNLYLLHRTKPQRHELNAKLDPETRYQIRRDAAKKRRQKVMAMSLGLSVTHTLAEQIDESESEEEFYDMEGDEGEIMECAPVVKIALLETYSIGDVDDIVIFRKEILRNRL